MIMEVNRTRLRGNVRAIASKSEAHRAILCAMLADQPTDIRLDSLSEDIAATLDCARALGGSVEPIQGGMRISPINTACMDSAMRELDCRESGSTLRFCLPLAGALGANARFTGKGRLPHRPITPLVEQLEAHGMAFTARTLPLETSGKLTGGEYSLPGNVSSQYLTGLLLALPITGEASRITLTTALESAGYVDMTLSMLRAFGVNVVHHSAGFGSFEIPAGSAYRSPHTCAIEGDWSGAAALMCIAALGGDLEIFGLNGMSAQPDRAIVDALLAMGAELAYRPNGAISVQTGRLNGAEIDVAQCPDIAPVLAAAASTAQGVTRIVNASRLRIKESDRLSATAACLREIGAEISADEDSMTIVGRSELEGGYADAQGDHRLVMALAVAAQRCVKPVRIIGAQSVNKSYPGFFEQLGELGAVCRQL